MISPLRQSNSPNLGMRSLLALLFATTLALCYLDFRLHFLVWIAFVPLLFAISGLGLFATYLISLLSGFCLFAIGTYWMVDFIQLSKGLNQNHSLGLATIAWLYCAHLIALMMLVYQFIAKRTRIHPFILFPLLVAGFTSYYPMIFQMRLADTLALFPVALQPIEFLGVASADVIIALTNIVIYSLLASSKKRLRDDFSSVKKSAPWIGAATLFVIWWAMSVKLFNDWEAKATSWSTMTVGIVQPNEKPALGKRTIYKGFGATYPPEIEVSEVLVDRGAELLIWPEAQKKHFLDNTSVKRAYSAQIADLQTPLLFQDFSSTKSDINGNISKQTNSAVYLNAVGEQSGRYDKIELIPFGEKMPFVSAESQWHPILKKAIGDFLIELTPGETPQAFDHPKAKLIPLICYETASPTIVANAVKQLENLPNNDKPGILVALSNDGWFNSIHQAQQHSLPSVLRAIEQRQSLIHAVNNGPSIVASPSGRILYSSDYGYQGGMLVDVPLE